MSGSEASLISRLAIDTLKPLVSFSADVQRFSIKSLKARLLHCPPRSRFRGPQLTSDKLVALKARLPHCEDTRSLHPNSHLPSKTRTPDG